MNIPDAAGVLEDHIQTGWTTPIGWVNVPQKDYDLAGDPLLEEGTVDWIKVEIDIFDSDQVEISNTCSRFYGVINIDINVPENIGSRTTLQHMEDLASLLHFKEVSNVRLKELSTVGKYSLTKGWMTTIVQIPFEFDREL